MVYIYQLTTILLTLLSARTFTMVAAIPKPTGNAVANVAAVSSTRSPTKQTFKPTTRFPTKPPTKLPTRRPSKAPTSRPTSRPTAKPTSKPTSRPTPRPSTKPTPTPVFSPTYPPTRALNDKLYVDSGNVGKRVGTAVGLFIGAVVLSAVVYYFACYKDKTPFPDGYEDRPLADDDELAEDCDQGSLGSHRGNDQQKSKSKSIALPSMT